MNSPGELFFNTTFWGGVIQEGSYFFNVIFSLSTKQNSFQTVPKPSFWGQGMRHYSVHDELPGGVIFSMSVPRGVVNREGGYSMGELFKKIWYAGILTHLSGYCFTGLNFSRCQPSFSAPMSRTLLLGTLEAPQLQPWVFLPACFALVLVSVSCLARRNSSFHQANANSLLADSVATLAQTFPKVS